jgi:hypothetical protein
MHYADWLSDRRIDEGAFAPGHQAGQGAGADARHLTLIGAAHRGNKPTFLLSLIVKEAL